MIYFPNEQDFNDCNGFSDYQKREANGTRFYFKEGIHTAIIYYHGNAGSACDRSIFKSVFEQSNASILFVEYAGYSNDTVKPSQKRILQDVNNINTYVQNYENIIVYGQSIGSGAASYHASLGNVDHLILATPFSTLSAVAQSKYFIYPAFIVTENFDNIDWLRNYNGSLLILHGDSDIVVPDRFSKELFDSIQSENKKYVLIQGKGHNNIWSSPRFQEEIMYHISLGKTI